MVQRLNHDHFNRLLQLVVVVGCIASFGSVAQAQAAEQGSSNEFKAIFDGTLDGWVGDASLWRVEDGVIIGESTKKRR